MNDPYYLVKNQELDQFKELGEVARLSEQRGKQHLLKSVSPGERLRLKDDVLKHMHPREWIFKKVEDDGRTILLLDESGGLAGA